MLSHARFEVFKPVNEECLLLGYGGVYYKSTFRWKIVASIVRVQEISEKKSI
jgi:hypothetical protein